MSTIDYLADAPAAEATTLATSSTAAKVPLTVRAAQILSALLALPMTVGSFMFAVITPDHRYAAWVTWLFSPIAFVTGLALLATAPRLAHGGAAIRRRMLGLLLVVQVFSLVKLTVFSEVESILFLVLACLIFALLARHPAQAAGRTSIRPDHG